MLSWELHALHPTFKVLNVQIRVILVLPMGDSMYLRLPLLSPPFLPIFPSTSPCYSSISRCCNSRNCASLSLASSLACSWIQDSHSSACYWKSSSHSIATFLSLLPFSSFHSCYLYAFSCILIICWNNKVWTCISGDDCVEIERFSSNSWPAFSVCRVCFLVFIGEQLCWAGLLAKWVNFQGLQALRFQLYCCHQMSAKHSYANYIVVPPEAILTFIYLVESTSFL